mmetsp:Transcript_49194/g.130243  ORF Transcript_49194/g.130243 Transcript_49194/m.130243 type:complete len:205 (+) Transcript_49194:640-1254(+)
MSGPGRRWHVATDDALHRAADAPRSVVSERGHTVWLAQARICDHRRRRGWSALHGVTRWRCEGERLTRGGQGIGRHERRHGCGFQPLRRQTRWCYIRSSEARYWPRRGWLQASTWTPQIRRGRQTRDRVWRRCLPLRSHLFGSTRLPGCRVAFNEICHRCCGFGLHQHMRVGSHGGLARGALAGSECQGRHHGPSIRQSRCDGR